MRKVTYYSAALADPKQKSICQLALMCQNYDSGESVYPDIEVLLNPETPFCDICSTAHGITFERVKSEKMFPEIWPNIEKYLNSAVIVGHNLVANGLDALEHSCDRYELDMPEIYYLCTRELAEEYIPEEEVGSYSFTNLCRHFDIAMPKRRSAYDDALAIKKLLAALVKTYDIDIESHIKRYIPTHGEPTVAEIISELYGAVLGFASDGSISPAERTYITQWAEEHRDWCDHRPIKRILNQIDASLDDGVVTIDEMNDLRETIKYNLQLVSGSHSSSATQVLSGLMKGITIDGKITVSECQLLQSWLYDNVHLTGHFAFDRLMHLVETVLEDGIVTAEETAEINQLIESLS